MTSTLLEVCTKSLEYSQRKHDLGGDFVEMHLNKMSNYEFLQHISDSLEAEGYMLCKIVPSGE
jgi:uncharacterized protein YpiB (UPF0302 family)